MTLSETQALFFNLITRPDAGRDAMERAFVGTPTLSAQDRVEVYANMYFWRIVDVMREDFGNLVKLLGEELYQALVREYLARHPSDNPSLAPIARHFPAFLSEAASRLPRRDVADLAALEWARASIFEEADAPPVSASAVQEIPHDEFALSTVRLIPALRVLTLGHDVTGVWRSLEADEPLGGPLAGRADFVVWRPEFEVFHSRIQSDEAQALRTAQEGATFGEVCEAFAGRPNAVETALAAIGSWFSDGMIAAIERPAPVR